MRPGSRQQARRDAGASQVATILQQRTMTCRSATRRPRTGCRPFSNSSVRSRLQQRLPVIEAPGIGDRTPVAKGGWPPDARRVRQPLRQAASGIGFVCSANTVWTVARRSGQCWRARGSSFADPPRSSRVSGNEPRVRRAVRQLRRWHLASASLSQLSPDAMRIRSSFPSSVRTAEQVVAPLSGRACTAAGDLVWQ